MIEDIGKKLRYNSGESDDCSSSDCSEADDDDDETYFGFLPPFRSFFFNDNL